jgi:hypothetical protein
MKFPCKHYSVCPHIRFSDAQVSVDKRVREWATFVAGIVLLPVLKANN